MPSLPVIRRVLSDDKTVLVHRVKRQASESQSKGQAEEIMSGDGEPVTEKMSKSEEPSKVGKVIAKEVSKHVKSHENRHHSTTIEPIVKTTTESTWGEVKHGVQTVAKTTHMPMSAVFLILLLIMTILAALFYFCVSKWWKKFKESDRGKGFKGIDLKSVNLIGNIGKEKVQPDTEELTANMEENEEEQQGKALEKENQKLGRLQFKLDYDFNTNTVRQ